MRKKQQRGAEMSCERENGGSERRLGGACGGQVLNKVLWRAGCPHKTLKGYEKRPQKEKTKARMLKGREDRRAR